MHFLNGVMCHVNSVPCHVNSVMCQANGVMYTVSRKRRILLSFPFPSSRSVPLVHPHLETEDFFPLVLSIVHVVITH